MNVSTKLPTSLRAYDALPGTAPSKLKSNISAKPESPESEKLATKSVWRIGTCLTCHGPIHDAMFLPRDVIATEPLMRLSAAPTGYCSKACRDNRTEGKSGEKPRVARHYTNCLGCGERFLAKRANNSTCSPNCRKRASRKGVISPMSQIPQNTPLESA